MAQSQSPAAPISGASPPVAPILGARSLPAALELDRKTFVYVVVAYRGSQRDGAHATRVVDVCDSRIAAADQANEWASGAKKRGESGGAWIKRLELQLPSGFLADPRNILEDFPA